MAENDGVLIVGGDSFIGKGVAALLAAGGMRVAVTSRRREDDGKIFLRLEEWEKFSVPDSFGSAILCAGVSGFAVCEAGGEAEQINTEFLPALAERFLRKGVFTAFLSSSAVFAADLPSPGENAPTCPATAYGRQKRLAEEKMRAAAGALGARESLAVVRLTKVVSCERSPLAAWRKSWQEGKAARAFPDVRTSPITLDYLAEALGRIITEKKPGTWHLSGSAGTSYAELCSRLAETLGAGAGRIEITTADASGVYAPFRPVDGALGMARTTGALGIRPQALERVLGCLAGQIKKSEE